jgi:predicted PolB exonuclease-like 3'-5' exonuclease
VRRFLTLDVETVPDEGLVAAVAGVPGRPYTEQLGRVVAERRARTGGRSDFLPLPFHRPVAACSLEAQEEGGIVTVTDLAAWSDRNGPGDERAFLERFWERAARSTLVTFHGRGFDLPVLELRSLKHAVQGAIPGEPSAAASHFDVKEALSGAGAAQSAPLDLYAKLVGLPGKEEVVGADVQKLYAAGDLDRIAAYCMTDVVQTYLLFLPTATRRARPAPARRCQPSLRGGCDRVSAASSKGSWSAAPRSSATPGRSSGWPCSRASPGPGGGSGSETRESRLSEPAFGIRHTSRSVDGTSRLADALLRLALALRREGALPLRGDALHLAAVLVAPLGAVALDGGHVVLLLGFEIGRSLVAGGLRSTPGGYSSQSFSLSLRGRYSSVMKLMPRRESASSSNFTPDVTISWISRCHCFALNQG